MTAPHFPTSNILLLSLVNIPDNFLLAARGLFLVYIGKYLSLQYIDMSALKL